MPTPAPVGERVRRDGITAAGDGRGAEVVPVGAEPAPGAASPPAPTAVRVSVVLPCLDEEAGVGGAVAAAQRGLLRAGCGGSAGEVLVVDNGSRDGSPGRAVAAGARLVRESCPGYGAAIAAGIRAARGAVVVVADADGSYDLDGLSALLGPLWGGADLVLGCRLGAAIAPGAMPALHRYLGTPLLGRVVAWAGGARVADSQSGFRAFRREAVLALGLRAPGMEYASEMLLRAGRAGLTVVEVPTPYGRRRGVSKLRPLSDGWRHLRLLLFLSPHLSLLLPGAAVVLLGLLLCALSLVAPAGIPVGDRVRWLPVFLGPMLLILGGQALLLGLVAAGRQPGHLPRADLWMRLARAGDLGRSEVSGRLLRGYGVVALVGGMIDAVLLGSWLLGRTGPGLVGVAGLAQALIVIGLGGVATIFALAK